MMASAMGRLSEAALTTDCGVPPTAIQIGNVTFFMALGMALGSFIYGPLEKLTGSSLNKGDAQSKAALQQINQDYYAAYDKAQQIAQA